MALAAVSCSNEEVVSVNNDANEIKFAVVSENATRALTSETFCNYVKPGDFDVWAMTGTKSYFEDVNYKKNAAGVWEANDQTNIHFWPNKGGEALDFYAMRNHETTTWAPTGDVKLSTTFAVADSVANQKDLIYAVAKGVTKPESGQTTLNFRHALSQIVFKAKNTNKNLAVKITHIAIVNVANSGTCNLPTEATTTNLQDHNSNNQIDGTESNETPTATTPVANTVCKWVSLSDQKKDYWVATKDCYLKGTATGTVDLTLSTDADGSSRDFSKSLLLIPQKLTGASISTSNTPKSIWDATGSSMLAVKCQIWNLNTANTSDDNDVLLFDSVAYIPLSATWEAGKKYIYTLVFGQANGGYDDGGKDILVPITFDVTVDDFTPVVSEEKNVYITPAP